jgi:methylphosphotriester-DNA--protein-cysteine methyltransferase
MTGPQTYTLLGADSKPYQSATKGQWGGHRGARIYGRLDCPAALRAIARGYTQYRVFFADQATAIAAGYRPCATCCPDRYREWKNTPAAAAARPVSGQAGAMPLLA